MSNQWISSLRMEWMLDEEEIINLVFGTSITSLNWKDGQKLCAIRQVNDNYLLSQNQFENVIPKLEPWKFRNCSEMNA
ncbi:5994_t:CDS:2 [Funneliformis caledonium]|uniref:5994_t:CDS:1 n=1 Tax=Funneliformis caledonium TaxID=1117310 RepID=A0A9N9D8Z2_9GLOM|nr:5994_t:CDS:2 [Funneliformis caledonium]